MGRGSLRVGVLAVIGFAAAGCPKGYDTPLILSSRTGDLVAVRDQIKLGANVEARDSDGDSALHAAAKHGYPEVIRALVGEGHANVDARDEDAQTPLHLAAKYGQLEAVKALVLAGANVNARDKDGWTPLHFAARQGSSQVINFLVDKGADVNAKNTDDEQTPVQTAMEKGRMEAADALRARGAKD